MTKRELAAFVLKLLGIYAIIQSLPSLGYLSSAIAAVSHWNDDIPNRIWIFFSMLIPFALLAAAGIVLLSCSYRLASVLVREDKNARLSTSLTGEDVQAIGFSVVAVFVFLSALPRLFQFVANLWLIASQSEYGRASSQFSVRAWQTGLSAAVQLILAMVLFLRARGLANLWRRIQVGRYVKIEEADSPREIDKGGIPRGKNAPYRTQKPPPGAPPSD